MVTYNIGTAPPKILWTLVRGDSAVFKVYVTDDAKVALDLSNWTVDLEIKRGSDLILALDPAPTLDDVLGYFTVSLLPEQSQILQTEDIFDIQLFDGDNSVWTVAQGEISMIEDITGPPANS